MPSRVNGGVGQTIMVGVFLHRVSAVRGGVWVLFALDFKFENKRVVHIGCLAVVLGARDCERIPQLHHMESRLP